MGPTPTAEASDQLSPSEAPASMAVEPTVSATLEPSVPVVPTSTAAPTPAPTLAPTPSPAPTVKPTPSPTPRTTAKPKSDRYTLLTACPDQGDCWIYTVRSGDNLYSIANYFGHSLSTIYAWNPQYPDKRLRVGAEIRMPPPTR